MKIDTIEYEMASEFLQKIPPGAAQKATGTVRRSRTDALTAGTIALSASTMNMFGSESIAKTIAMSASEAAPAIDEAAILFALGEMSSVEQLLMRAIEEPLHGHDDKIAWAMLLDLYQVLDQRRQFDDLSIAYANAFETSPPAWIDLPHQAPRLLSNSPKVPAVIFSGKLDGGILPQLTHAQTLASEKRSIRMEFTRVTEVDAVGCSLLLSVLKKLQMPDQALMLIGALELTMKIRDIVEVGRRDECEAPWLLLLEIFRLLHLEQQFEDCSIDYCVTYEVSPPAFIAPHNKVTSTAPAPGYASEADLQYMMPPMLTERCETFIAAIESYAKSHNPALLDCSHLIRVDFNAANQLLAHLQPLAMQGAIIKMHHVNHLVAALLRVIGLHELLQLELRKI